VSTLLYIDGDYILSQEGTTQGDPLAMPMYALGVVPLIRQLAGINVSQVWYADDASAGGILLDCAAGGMNYLVLVLTGYFPNPSKTCKAFFCSSGKDIVSWNGYNYLRFRKASSWFCFGF